MVFGGILICLPSLLVDASPVKEYGFRTCLSVEQLSKWYEPFVFFRTFWMFINYAWLTCIFTSLHDDIKQLQEDIPQLKYHLNANLYFCIAIWVSTIIVTVVMAMACSLDIFICTDNVAQFLSIVDALVNSFIMFYIISAPRLQQPRKPREKPVSNSIEGGEFVWIRLPSIPAIYVATHVIEEHDYLKQYVLVNESEIFAMEHAVWKGSERKVFTDIEAVMSEIEENELSDSIGAFEIAHTPSPNRLPFDLRHDLHNGL